MKGISIVVDCRMITASGVGRYQREILQRILPEFPEVTLLGNDPWLYEFKKVHPNLSVVAFDVPIYSVREQLLFNKLIPRCDLFWSPHFNIPFLSVMARKRVVTIHDAYHLAFAHQLSFVQRIYSQKMIRSALAKSDAVITVSVFSKEELVKWTSRVFEDKISVIHNGVSLIGAQHKHDDLFMPLKDSSGKSAPESAYFLYVGNIKPHKNLQTALFGFKSFLLNNPDLADMRFIIVGKKEGFVNGGARGLNHLLSKEVEIAQNVSFTGAIDDNQLARLYKGACSLVFPSLYEGFGLPPLEAMSLGCPAIVSKTACLPEVCGDAVLYFDPLSPEDIARKMEEISRRPDLRNKLQKKGFKQIQRYSWDRAAAQHLQLFNSIVQ